MGEFKIHHVRFFDYKPLTVNCLAYDANTQRLALSRSDGSVEIWSKADNWFQEKVTAVSEERSVEGLVWLRSRLISVGLDSNLVEYDLQSLQIKRQVSSSAGAVWCVTKNETEQQLAVGTEDGCVVLFDGSDQNLEYLRTFDKLEGRILCIAWHTGESVIVTGGPDNIRIWSVKSGQALQRISLGGKDTIVWCLAVTSDMTIISGDSRGKTSFWNGKQGTRITQFQGHKADVLTLCVDESETSVFCGGVDPAVVQYSFMSPSADSGWRSWVRSSVRTHHTHDVRASVVADNVLVTAGVDTNLVCCQLGPGTKRKFVRLPAVPSLSMVNVAAEAGLLLLRYPTFLELWRLGHSDAESNINGEILPLRSQQLQLLQLKARSGERIACSTISRDGSVIAFSDQEKLRVHKLSITDLKSLTPSVQVSRFPLPSSQNVHPAQRMTFTPDGSRLVVGTSAGTLEIWDISGDKGSLLQTLPLNSEAEEVPQHSFTCLCVSDNGRFAAVSTSGRSVQLYSVEEGQLLCALPASRFQATALSFTPHGSTLLVTLADHTVQEFDVHKKEYTVWSRGRSFPEQWLHQRGWLRAVMCQPGNPSKLFLNSEHSLLVVDRAQPMPDAKYVLFSGKPSSDATPRPLIACSRYKYILHMEFVSPDSLVVVERTPMAIQDQLPPALRQKKFGT